MITVLKNYVFEETCNQCSELASEHRCKVCRRRHAGSDEKHFRRMRTYEPKT